MKLPVKLIVQLLTLGVPALREVIRQRRAAKKADAELAREKARREGH